MRRYGYISDGVLVDRREQAERIMAPWPIPVPFDATEHLDEFYIAAHEGVDFETGEVVDPAREVIANTTDGVYYPFLISLYTGDWS